MRRFSLNPVHPKNIKAAIVLIVIFGALLVLALLVDRFGIWIFWMAAIGLAKVMNDYYTKEAARKKRIEEVRTGRSNKLKRVINSR